MTEDTLNPENTYEPAQSQIAFSLQKIAHDVIYPLQWKFIGRSEELAFRFGRHTDIQCARHTRAVNLTNIIKNHCRYSYLPHSSQHRYLEQRITPPNPAPKNKKDEPFRTKSKNLQ